MKEMARVIGIVHVLVGVLLIGLAVPLILKRVGMNYWYGVRIPTAFRSEANWYAINVVGGWWLSVAGMLILLVGACVILRPPTSTASVVLVSMAPVPVVLLTLVPILRYANGLRS